jgi:Flp pilus assembly protein TadD
MKGSREILERATEAPRLVSLARLCLSRALARCGQLAEAEREARVAIAAAPNDAVRMYAHAVVADVLVATRRFEEARVLSSEAVTILDKLGVLLVGDLLALIVQAEALEGTGDHEGARRAITRARRMFDKRRAFLSENARAVFDAHSPDARRLFEVETRLAG